MFTTPPPTHTHTLPRACRRRRHRRMSCRRVSAWLGTRRSLVLGGAWLLGHYCLAVPAARRLLLLRRLPPRLNLEPWHRAAADPPPHYAAAALLWPLYGDGLHWQLIHLLSNGFAWAYGAYEWQHSFSAVRARNGLRY